MVRGVIFIAQLSGAMIIFHASLKPENSQFAVYGIIIGIAMLASAWMITQIKN